MTLDRDLGRDDKGPPLETGWVSGGPGAERVDILLWGRSEGSRNVTVVRDSIVSPRTE